MGGCLRGVKVGDVRERGCVEVVVEGLAGWR
jgi:hypothetical protein